MYVLMFACMFVSVLLSISVCVHVCMFVHVTHCQVAKNGEGLSEEEWKHQADLSLKHFKFQDLFDVFGFVFCFVFVIVIVNCSCLFLFCFVFCFVFVMARTTRGALQAQAYQHPGRGGHRLLQPSEHRWGQLTVATVGCLPA